MTFLFLNPWIYVTIMRKLCYDLEKWKNYMFFKTMITYCNKQDQLFNILISNLCLYLTMSEMIWKCFRCNLSFKDDEIAKIHKEISSHSVSKVKALVA